MERDSFQMRDYTMLITSSAIAIIVAISTSTVPTALKRVNQSPIPYDSCKGVHFINISHDFSFKFFRNYNCLMLRDFRRSKVPSLFRLQFFSFF